MPVFRPLRPDRRSRNWSIFDLIISSRPQEYLDAIAGFLDGIKPFLRRQDVVLCQAYVVGIHIVVVKSRSLAE